MIENVSETKNWFSENKIEKPLATLIGGKKEEKINYQYQE